MNKENSRNLFCNSWNNLKEFVEGGKVINYFALVESNTAAFSMIVKYVKLFYAYQIQHSIRVRYAAYTFQLNFCNEILKEGKVKIFQLTGIYYMTEIIATDFFNGTSFSYKNAI
ncbi:CLUMA_CG003851, isoform A [Clunio marinus]|uniref:CLUMA_CG003851, isoform A n=1 Tax=Clunio marinus TaxID=568069 RepID=A0A1J1HUF8_9DIPT|nr:CLUMA_CG003851, isoform A [Clunio marinus]